MDIGAIASNTSLLGFALSAVIFLISFGREDQGRSLAIAALVSFFVATLAVSTALAVLTHNEQFDTSAGYILACAIGWLSIFGHWKFRVPILGAIVAPLATLILLIQLFVSPPGAPVTSSDPGDWLSTIHVAMAAIGMAFAIIACAISVFYIWQQQLLKKKLLDQIPKNFPAVDRMDRLLTVSLWIGFIFITLGLMSGAVYTQMYVPRAKIGLEFKVIWAITVWVWYLATLLAKNVFRRPGKRIAQMSLGGFALLAIALFGMSFFRTFGGTS